MSPGKISAKTGGKKGPKNDVLLWKQPCFFVDFWVIFDDFRDFSPGHVVHGDFPGILRVNGSWDKFLREKLTFTVETSCFFGHFLSKTQLSKGGVFYAEFFR